MGALVGASIIPAILVCLCLMGFSFLGVAAGSFAACRQAQIGLIPAKSCFSICQSIAMSQATYYLIPKFTIIGFGIGLISYFFL
jgi:hypothetical protein